MILSKLKSTHILIDRSVLTIYEDGEVWQLFPAAGAKWKKISVDPRNMVDQDGGSIKLDGKDEYGV